MLGWRLGKTVVMTTALFSLSIQGAQSRSTRQMRIAEQVETSDVVFVGKVINLVEPTPNLSGVNRFALVKVKDVLKGTVPRKVSFVVSGHSAELNPDCCETGETYIFFSRLGYDMLEESGGSLVMSTFGKDRFLSATNGRFSTFLVRGDRIVGWPADSTCDDNNSVLKADVYACIRSQIESIISQDSLDN